MINLHKMKWEISMFKFGDCLMSSQCMCMWCMCDDEVLIGRNPVLMFPKCTGNGLYRMT